MKLAVVTRVDDRVKEQSDLTHPILEDFCEKWGADFITLDGPSECLVGDGKVHFRILRLYDLYDKDKYDRILSIDSDVVINKICPNPFDEVPPEMIGSVLEDCGSRQTPRRQLIKDIQNKFGDVGWSKGYINTGFFLTSSIHKDIFTKINGQFWEGFGFDDPHLGWNINKYKFPIYELDYRWNHMSMYSESWNGSKDPLQSYIIHFAGKSMEWRVQAIKETIREIYG